MPDPLIFRVQPRTLTFVLKPGTGGASIGGGGTPGVVQEFATATTTLSGHRAVLLVAGGAAYASNTNPAHAGDTIGITTGAASAGGTATVQTFGRIVEPSWSWTPSLPVFLGAGGALTQARPTAAGGAAFLQIIGYADTATSLFIRVASPILF